MGATPIMFCSARSICSGASCDIYLVCLDMPQNYSSLNILAEQMIMCSVMCFGWHGMRNCI